MFDKFIVLVIFLSLGSCSAAIVVTRVHCEITGVEADCPHWVR